MPKKTVAEKHKETVNDLKTRLNNLMKIQNQERQEHQCNLDALAESMQTAMNENLELTEENKKLIELINDSGSTNSELELELHGTRQRLIRAENRTDRFIAVLLK